MTVPLFPILLVPAGFIKLLKLYIFLAGSHPPPHLNRQASITARLPLKPQKPLRYTLVSHHIFKTHPEQSQTDHTHHLPLCLFAPIAHQYASTNIKDSIAIIQILNQAVQALINWAPPSHFHFYTVPSTRNQKISSWMIPRLLTHCFRVLSAKLKAGRKPDVPASRLWLCLY